MNNEFDENYLDDADQTALDDYMYSMEDDDDLLVQDNLIEVMLIQSDNSDSKLVQSEDEIPNEVPGSGEIEFIQTFSMDNFNNLLEQTFFNYLRLYYDDWSNDFLIKYVQNNDIIFEEFHGELRFDVHEVQAKINQDLIDKIKMTFEENKFFDKKLEKSLLIDVSKQVIYDFLETDGSKEKSTTLETIFDHAYLMEKASIELHAGSPSFEYVM